MSYRQLSENEKNDLWDILVTACAEIPDFCKYIEDIGGKASTLSGVLVAAFDIFKSKHEYKRFYQHFEKESRDLIPCSISESTVKNIFSAVKDHLKKMRTAKKKLSFYYLHKDKWDELSAALFKECRKKIVADEVSDEPLHAVLDNMVHIILQNNESVSLFTELSDIVKDILDRLKQDGKDIDALKDNVAELKEALDKLVPKYTTYISNAGLPSEFTKSENILSFRNSGIQFRGRKNERRELGNFMKRPGVSVTAVTGPGGSGKSRLAFFFANSLDAAECKCVWLDHSLLKAIVSCNDLSYDKQVLFICDYASQYEDDLKTLIDSMSRTGQNVKFLLLERSAAWFTDFRKHSNIIAELSSEESIELSGSDFTRNECSEIMDDLSKQKYNSAVIPENTKDQIIKKAAELSGESCSVRCLFLLLVTDSYLKGDPFLTMSADELLYNYIEHSKEIVKKEYKKEVIDIGFRVLAYATACDGIKWEDEHPAIQNDLNSIMEHFPDDRYGINRFFGKLSEEEKADTVSALKPDLIGEFLFLHTWLNLTSSRKKWLSALLVQEYSRVFLARCLADWEEKSAALCNMLSEKGNDAGQRINSAKVYNSAVREAHSTEAQMKWLQKIKDLDTDLSADILAEYVDAVRYVFEHAKHKNTRAECTNLICAIDFEQYSCESPLLGVALNDAASIYQDNGEYKIAIEFFEKALTICENVHETEHSDTAAIYNNIAGIYDDKGDYDKALEYYEKALTIFEKVLGTEHPDTATTYDNLALVYMIKRNHVKALEYCEKALNIFEKVHGTEHPDTAIAYNNIAGVYDAKGDYDKALKYYEKALKIKLTILGTEHHDTAATYNNIAGVYKDICDYDTAKKYYKKALTIFEKVLGTDHHDTAIAYNNIASVYKALGDYDKALEYYNKAFAIFTKTLGFEHEYTVLTLSAILKIKSELDQGEKQ
ncbi:tetratricopeptide repeat protein [Ruminococcus sp.]|uniref:tetratricopeptide repeat protein n=1 Tax=Ruminococcus sp. TaxID=41978 RepID=UPI0025FA5E02|nr:tetratricopeptide repeat protein [Ruminococcus sp.]MBR1432170.1 ATP-binding protein [Ruminococcus sp.]